MEGSTLNDNINVELFDVLAPCGNTVIGAIGVNGSGSGQTADLPLSSCFCE